MDVSPQEVRQIATLARIDITEAEQDKFRKELSAILEFVKKLGEVDTEHVLPMTGGNVLENIMRADKKADEDLEGKSAELIESLPGKKGRWAKVKGVFS